MIKKISLIFLIVLLSTGVIRAVPNMMNYRGKLLESGSAVTGSRDIRFQIWDAPTGGFSLWDSGFQTLTVNNGYYNYTFVGLPSSIFTNDFLYLEVEISGTGALSPRERLVSVGYALNADMVDGQHASGLQSPWTVSGSNVYRNKGKVGIGIISPIYKLDVNGMARIASFRMETGASNGRVLTSDAAGVGTWQKLPSSIGGSGSLNYIPKFTSENTIGNSIIYETNNRIGIGTISPNEQLEITRNFRLPPTASASSGVIYVGNNRFIHNYGKGNLFMGENAGNFTLLAGADYNTGIGLDALFSLTSGLNNTALGAYSLYSVGDAQLNVGIGYYSLYSTTGNMNTAIGSYSGRNTTIGTNNVFIGYQAGNNNSAGSRNVFIGNQAGFGETLSDKLYIDNSSTVSPLIWGDFAGNILRINGNLGVGANPGAYKLYVLGTTFVSSTSYLFGSVGIGTPPGAYKLYVNGTTYVSSTSYLNGSVGIGIAPGPYKLDVNGTTRLNNNVGIRMPPGINSLMVNGDASKSIAGSWLANSDRKIKKDIHTVKNGLEIINKLRPVKFKYIDEYKKKYDGVNDCYYYNFIAQEYQEVFPDSVQDNGEGILQIDTYNVRLFMVSAIQELSKKSDKQQEEINDLKEKIKNLKFDLEKKVDKLNSRMKFLENKSEVSLK